MNRSRQFVFFMLPMVLICSAFVQAQQARDQIFIGARPIAMGEAFVAIADDGTAIYWNPAGLPALRKYEINVAYADLFGIGLKNTYVSLFAPVTKRFVLGADWFRLGYDDVENGLGLSFAQNIFHFSFGYRLFDALSIGGNLKFINLSGSEDNISLGKASGSGYDVGLLLYLGKIFGLPPGKLRFGAMLHDASNTGISYENGAAETLFKRSLRYGLAYKPAENITIGLDVDDRLHLGAEYWLFHTLALRAGLQKDLHSSENMIFSFGLGIARTLPGFDNVRANYAFSDHPDMPNTTQYSAGIAFDLFPELIDIERFEMRNAFASLYKYHSQHPVGKVLLKYRGKTPLQCKVTTTLSLYSDPRGYSYPLVLQPGDSIYAVPVRVLFHPAVLELNETTPLIAHFDISYESKGRRRHIRTTSQPFPLFQRGVIDWARGTAQAAAFIEPTDESVGMLVDSVRFHLADDPRKAVAGQDELSLALQSFHLLSKMGVRYAEDPESPYRQTWQGIDNVYYPAETLRRSRGDCDDTSVLFAAMLESAGVSTALVAQPGHLLMMFDTGTPLQAAPPLLLSEDMFYPWDERYWIPVETTMLGESFVAAWQAGAQELKTRSIEEIAAVRRAWLKYPPAKPPLPNGYALLPRFSEHLQDRAKGIEELKALKLAQVTALERKLAKQPQNLSLRKQLALQYARWPWRGALLEKAKAAYRETLALTKESGDSLAVFNDLANLFLLQEQAQPDSANKLYLRALKMARRMGSPDSAGILLNMGTLFLAVGQDSIADQFYARVVKDKHDFPVVEKFLGFSLREGADSLRAAPGGKKSKKKRANKKKVRRRITKGKRGPRSQRFEYASVNQNLKFSGWEVDDVFFWAIDKQ